MESGLNRMARNHVHMAPGMPGKGSVISGMRGSCDVVVDVNMVRAIWDGGLEFYLSSNEVILSEGIEGLIPSKYFRSVWDLRKGEYLHSSPIKYLMVYDFECQCEDRNDPKTLEFNEIIEFPVVVVDVEKQEVVAE